MSRRTWITAAVRIGLGLLAAAAIVDPGLVSAQGAAGGARLGGYQGSAAASGLSALYSPKGLLPTAPPVDLGVPDALATVASGPTTFARAAAADPGDLLANPDALLSLGSEDWQPGTIPPYPYRATASSATGQPTSESSPAPGLDARAQADAAGSRAQATMPGLAAPAIATAGSMSAVASTEVSDSQVVVRSRTEISDFDLLGVLTVESLVTDLVATADAATTTMEGGTTVTGATLLGQPVTIDADGVRLADGAPAAALPAVLGGDLNDVLASAGLRITVADVVEQGGTEAGRRAAAGLRIDFDLSDDTVPVLAALADAGGALPPIDSPVPGVPGVADVVALSQVRHLGALQVGRGEVALTVRPAATFAPFVAPAVASPSSPAAPAGSVPALSAMPPLAPAVSAPSAPTPPAATLASDVGEIPFGTGLGSLILLALLVQPLLGHRIALATRALLGADDPQHCGWEQR